MAVVVVVGRSVPQTAVVAVVVGLVAIVWSAAAVGDGGEVVGHVHVHLCW